MDSVNSKRNIYSNPPGSSDTEENVGSKRLRLDQGCQAQTSSISLAKRKIESTTGLSFCAEEFYDKILGYGYNNYVLPFKINNIKHFKVDPKVPTLEKDYASFISLPEEQRPALCQWDKALKRLSNIFTHGFNNVCRTTITTESGEEVIKSRCHHFVNYIAFGMDAQKDHNFNGWYENLPFTSTQDFDQEKLQWGDIVQLFSDNKLKHSLFYLGNGKYISKHGSGNIFFQSLSAAQASYPSDLVRIVRLSPEYHSKELQFKLSYEHPTFPLSERMKEKKIY